MQNFELIFARIFTGQLNFNVRETERVYLLNIEIIKKQIRFVSVNSADNTARKCLIYDFLMSYRLRIADHFDRRSVSHRLDLYGCVCEQLAR